MIQYPKMVDKLSQKNSKRKNFLVVFPKTTAKYFFKNISLETREIKTLLESKYNKKHSW